MSEVKLSIVMPSHIDRYPFPIVGQIKEQAAKFIPRVEFLCLLDNGPMSTGEKMNRLYQMAHGEYVCAIGDDDLVSPDYVETLVKALDQHPGIDVVTFDHLYYVDGSYNAVTAVGKDFINEQHDGLHTRRPTPKCAIRRDICLQYQSPPVSNKEDESMSEWLQGRLETGYRIARPIYTHTWHGSNKEWREQQARIWRRG